MGTALFVHGAGGGAWEWNVWARVFAASDLAVHVPELQPVRAGLARTRLADYSAQVAGHLKKLRSHDLDGKIVLVGASLGGLLALMNAELADALILVNPMPPAPVHPDSTARSDYPAIVPWGANATLENTRRALPDADEASCLYAFRRWRDESGAVLNDARAGIVVATAGRPILVMASECDQDVSAQSSTELAATLGADFLLIDGASHVGPLLGRTAAELAERAVAWLNDSERIQ
jgi:pimeloyl-ACP methyl ester carboxylesterase